MPIVQQAIPRIGKKSMQQARKKTVQRKHLPYARTNYQHEVPENKAIAYRLNHAPNKGSKRYHQAVLGLRFLS
jgi:hypothetical protein